MIHTDTLLRQRVTVDHPFNHKENSMSNKQFHRCPNDKLPDIDIVGCGHEFDSEPDKEGLVDCPNCGMFFRAPVSVSVPKNQLDEICRLVHHVDTILGNNQEGEHSAAVNRLQ